MSSVSRKVFVAGGSKALGSAILRAFAAAGQAGFAGVGDSEPDLRDQQAVDAFFEAERPDWVVYAAGKAGGIGLNRRAPADLILDNLLCATHVIHAAQRFGAQKLLYLASSCVYPKDAAQPIRENSMYSGPLEPTNLAYASAKLAGLELCRAMRQQFGVGRGRAQAQGAVRLADYAAQNRNAIETHEGLRQRAPLTLRSAQTHKQVRSAGQHMRTWCFQSREKLRQLPRSQHLHDLPAFLRDGIVALREDFAALRDATRSSCSAEGSLRIFPAAASIASTIIT